MKNIEFEIVGVECGHCGKFYEYRTWKNGWGIEFETEVHNEYGDKYCPVRQPRQLEKWRDEQRRHLESFSRSDEERRADALEEVSKMLIRAIRNNK